MRELPATTKSVTLYPTHLLIKGLQHGPEVKRGAQEEGCVLSGLHAEEATHPAVERYESNTDGLKSIQINILKHSYTYLVSVHQVFVGCSRMAAMFYTETAVKQSAYKVKNNYCWLCMHGECSLSGKHCQSKLIISWMGH
jgi:hypothetical protein